MQKRVLNRSKGPAVRALRAQTDKREYALEMKKVVERLVYLHKELIILFILLVLPITNVGRSMWVVKHQYYEECTSLYFFEINVVLTRL